MATISLPENMDSRWRPTLYVGDLHPETTEGDLEDAFSWVGPLESIQICRDSVSQRSLCYGYVNFYCVSHASKALACLNHTNLRGKPMRIMWWRMDIEAIKSGIGNVFVKNLAPSVTSAQLEKMFSKFGTTLSCKVAEENGKSKCFGFVQFDSLQSAVAAIRSLHGMEFEGKKLYVSMFKKKEERMVMRKEHKITSLFVKNFDCNLTEDELREMFSKHGKVLSAVIVKDDEGNSRCFGFVKFDSDEDAKKAIEALNGELIGSRKLFVGRAQMKAEKGVIRCSRLHVGNLRESVDERKLHKLFSSYGDIVSTKIIRHNGISRGSGFVSFSSPENAQAAMDSLKGTFCDGNPLYVAPAYQREERFRKPLMTSYAPNRPQPFFTPKDKIFPSAYTYNIPSYSFPMSMPHFSPYQISMYQNFNRNLSSFYSAKQVFNFHGNGLTNVSKPVKSSPSVPMPSGKPVAQKQPRTVWEPKNKNTKGTGKDLTAAFQFGKPVKMNVQWKPITLRCRNS